MPEISPYIVVSVVTVVICQILKFAVDAFSNQIDFKQLIRTDGVPKIEIAVVAALIVTALAVDGAANSIAGLTVVVGLYFVWRQSKDLTSKQVGLSALVGLVSAAILTVSYWSEDINLLSEQLSSSQIRLGFIGFAAVLVVGEALSYIARRKSLRKLPTSRKLSRAFRLSLTLPAIVGLFITFAQKETLGIFDARIWTFLVLLWIIAANVWYFFNVYGTAKQHLAEEAEHFKKSKSKTKTKKKKSKRKK
jgi:hypothetical protein